MTEQKLLISFYVFPLSSVLPSEAAPPFLLQMINGLSNKLGAIVL